MKHNSFIALTLLILLGACSKYDDPEVRVAESYSFYVLGNGQRGFQNNYLSDSLTITVTDQFGNYVPGIEITINMASGNGEVDKETGTTNRQGIFSAKWKLGASNNQQNIKATVIHSDGRDLGAVDFIAYGFPHEGWSDIPAAPENVMTDMMADTVRHITAALSNGTLYIRGENYFTWTAKTAYPFYGIQYFAQTPDHTFFVVSANGPVFASGDLNGPWFQCTNPLAEFDYNVKLKSTSDNSIWISSASTGIRRSRDHGQTWEKDTVGMQAGERLEDVFRLSDGDLLFLSSAGRLYYSDNDGASWTIRTTPEFARKLYVTPTDEVILFSQYNGITIYKSTDKGLQFTFKDQYYPQLGSNLNHAVLEYNNTYYVLIQGYGILTTTDFETFTVFKRDDQANDMMMDMDGNILLKDFQYGQTHYYARPK